MHGNKTLEHAEKLQKIPFKFWENKTREEIIDFIANQQNWKKLSKQ